ncbi:corticotropin-releasing factor receptor 2 [Caerostris extrusa]|uniref:Corticotropin-releasing factor receptor 2 n=1 Tax=Caerostris extrusa TaxID=172846 RepID=A0AAV4U4U2_CAEEX|nr:corticotropin-releasing factor receptor 2 [Caerostris extrusa]
MFSILAACLVPTHWQTASYSNQKAVHKAVPKPTIVRGTNTKRIKNAPFVAEPDTLLRWVVQHEQNRSLTRSFVAEIEAPCGDREHSRAAGRRRKMLSQEECRAGANDSGCPAAWDNLFCWPPTPVNTTVRLPCAHIFPFLQQDNDTDALAFRRCDAQGHWADGGWTNYSECEKLDFQEEPEAISPSSIGIVVLSLSSLSLVCLCAALAVFSAFRSLSAPRPSAPPPAAVAAATRPHARRRLRGGATSRAFPQPNRLAVQGSAGAEDVQCHGQRQLDVRGGSPAARFHHHLRLRQASTFPPLPRTRMGHSRPLRSDVGGADVVPLEQSLLGRLRTRPFHLAHHWTHDRRTFGKCHILSEHRPNLSDQNEDQFRHRGQTNQAGGTGDGASVPSAGRHPPAVLRQPRGRWEPVYMLVNALLQSSQRHQPLWKSNDKFSGCPIILSLHLTVYLIVIGTGCAAKGIHQKEVIDRTVAAPVIPRSGGEPHHPAPAPVQVPEEETALT